jgi:hypothetical protein
MKKSEGFISMQGLDETVGVRCPCTSFMDDVPELSVSGGWVTRCPRCGRGFRTEMVLWVYGPGENDPEILNQDEWEQKLADDMEYPNPLFLL